MVGQAGALPARMLDSVSPSWTCVAETEARKTRVGVEGAFPWEAYVWDQKLVRVFLKGSSSFPKSPSIAAVAAETPDKQTLDGGVPQVRPEGSDPEPDR